MNNFIIFDDIDSRDYDIEIFPEEVDTVSQREYTEIVIPGKQGILTLDNKRNENVSHSYKGVIYEKYAEFILSDFRSALASKIGTKILQDSINPEEFYRARYMAELSPVLTKDRSMVKFALNFDRDPQRFLKSGLMTRNLTLNVNLMNPTPYDAKPLIKLTGYGSLTIGQTVITITGTATQEIYIDCELMEAYEYSGSAMISANNKISMSGTDFPVLAGGKATYITRSYATVTALEITPRWWRL